MMYDKQNFIRMLEPYTKRLFNQIASNNPNLSRRENPKQFLCEKNIEMLWSCILVHTTKHGYKTYA